MTYQEEREAIVHRFATFGIALADIRTILTTAQGLQTIAINECNQPLTCTQQRRREMLRRKLHAIASCYPATIREVTTSNDPRDCVVKMTVCIHTATGFDEREYGIPVRR